TTIHDVGTTFAVRNDSGAGVRVIVTSGSVLLRSTVSRESGALLAAGDLGVVQGDGHISTQRHASSAPYLAWMRDSLVLREAPIAEVSSDLRRWYGVTLRVDDT